MILRPPKLEDLPAGTQLIAGLGKSTVIADIDFETYSPAGFIWNIHKQRFDPPAGAMKKGLPTIGAAVYAEHPDTEVLSCAYDLKDGKGVRLWTPDQGATLLDLFHHVHSGGLLEAWYSPFEHWIWSKVCVRKYGWPAIRLDQFRCAMSKARAHALPGSLDAAGKILETVLRKDKEGKRLLDKFSMPRKPTKKDPRTRIRPIDDPRDAQALYSYNVKDIQVEAEISSLVPDLSPGELAFWLCDQTINHRGVAMDREGIANCRAVVEQAHDKYNRELMAITGGKAVSASEIQKLRAWLMEYGVSAPSLDSDTVTDLLSIGTLPLVCRRVLEIRERIGSAAVKKLYAMTNQLTASGRIHDLFIYHSARTGRTAGTGVQPQNLPNSGLDVHLCGASSCRRHFSQNLLACPWCGSPTSGKAIEWNPAAVNDALEVMACRNLECVEYYFGDAIATISGCLRGLFVAAPGHDLICSDYSAIEAVVLAALAGEQWRMDVFNTHGKIYEMSASKITGIPFDEFILYKATSGQHHPMRKKVGKVSELASGYQGWIGAWKQFGADEFFNDEEIKQAILAWRDASPTIVEMWGGQPSWRRSEYYGLEGAAIQAVLNPGQRYSYRALSYIVNRDVLYCQLPSGRLLTYHKPRLSPSDRRPDTLSLSFEGWNSNPKYGAIGWIRLNTYGGKLTENVVQAVARDILTHAIVNLEKFGYGVVLHVHDEIVCEVREGFGSVEALERVMSQVPEWAAGWPIKASGGWRAKRYAK
jgi:DNA polymerase bacteriophage-type